MSTLHQKAARAMAPAIVTVACVLAIAVAANAIVAFARATPHVGDIVAFTPTDAVLDEESMRLIVHRMGRSDCVLDLGVVRRAGGSIIVETEPVGQAGGFRVHWAGRRTSNDTGDCGGDAELTVAQRDLDTLALSAGGYGVGPKRMPIITGDISN
jgi:hypothetical protein